MRALQRAGLVIACDPPEPRRAVEDEGISGVETESTCMQARTASSPRQVTARDRIPTEQARRELRVAVRATPTLDRMIRPQGSYRERQSESRRRLHLLP